MKTRKLLSVILCLAFMLGMGITNVFAEGEPRTADVYIVSQAEGAFLCAPQTVTVSEDTAETYGLTDSVDGVSVLDALIAAHELIFEDDFTPSTVNYYFQESGEFISAVFGIDTYLFGFMLNGGTPNDGTDSPYGGYNGTTAFTQEITDGDKVDFFIYQDGSYFSDNYSWIDGELSALPGNETEITVSGSMAMMGYLYETPDDFKASAEPLEGVSLAWVDENGGLTEITGVVTDDEGKATIAIPSDMPSGTYYITATGTDDYDSPVIMNVYPFTVIKPSASVYIAAQAEGAFLCAPGTVTVSRYTAENYGFTDSVDGVSGLDALIKAHELIFGDAFTPSTANDYFAASGGYISKVFGIETYAFGFMLNGGTPNDGTDSPYGGYNGTTPFTQEIDDGDKVDFFIYQDGSYYSDIYTWIDGDLSALPGGEIAINASGSMAMMGYLYETPDDFKDSAEPAEGVSFAWIDNNGGLTEISGVVSDDNGDAVINIPANMEPGVYYLTAVGVDDYDSPVIMNPTIVTIVNEMTAYVSIYANADYVTANNGKPFIRLPVTLSDKPEYNIDDFLSAAHELYAPAGHEYASSYSRYGLGITKLWGDVSGSFGYWQNDELSWSLEDPVSDEANITAYIYKDQEAWGDVYTRFENQSVTVPAESEITLTLQKYDWGVYSFIPCAGAAVEVIGLPGVTGTTDADGKVTLTFPKKGTYTVVAKNSTIPLVPASAVVTVDYKSKITGFDVEISGSYANVSILTENVPQNAKVYLVSYNGDVTTQVETPVLTNGEAEARIPITGVTSIKLFIWNGNLSPLVESAEYKFN